MTFPHMLALITLPLVLALPANAQNLPPGVVGARLAPGWTEPDGTRRAALIVDLEPGWKTYWRAPGEAGVPPMLDWTESANLGPVTIDWPAPEVFNSQGIRTLGYHDRMVLPLRLPPIQPDQPIQARLRADLGVCQDICVPVTLNLEAELSKTTGPGLDADLIRAALARVPVAGPQPVRCDLTPIRDGMRLTAQFAADAGAGVTSAAIESDEPGVWVAPVDLTDPTAAADGALVLAADLVPPTAKPFAPDLSALRFTLIGAGATLDSQGCPQP